MPLSALKRYGPSPMNSSTLRAPMICSLIPSLSTSAEPARKSPLSRKNGGNSMTAFSTANWTMFSSALVKLSWTVVLPTAIAWEIAWPVELMRRTTSP